MIEKKCSSNSYYNIWLSKEESDQTHSIMSGG